MTTSQGSLFDSTPPQTGRHGYVVLNQWQPDTYLLVRKCPICRLDARAVVPAQGLWDWEHGRLVQTAMPDLSAEDRETVTSGIHPACWDLF